MRLDQSLYDHDFVNPLPIIHNGYLVMTPPKNASSFFNRMWGFGVQPPREGEVHTKIAIKRDPIQRWLSALNQQRQRLQWGVWKHKQTLEENISFWEQDPNEIIDIHLPKNSPIREISEFCGQYEWAGSMTEYDICVYPRHIDKWILPMLDVIPKDAPRNEYKGKEKRTEKDLTSESKTKIMYLYENDYKNGWC